MEAKSPDKKTQYLNILQKLYEMEVFLYLILKTFTKFVIPRLTRNLMGLRVKPAMPVKVFDCQYSIFNVKKY